MGQYYTPVILSEDGKIEHYMSSYDFDNGAKLMEHSWLGNQFVAAFESLLAQEAPRRVVWSGDYADAEVGPDGEPLIIKSDLYSSGEGDGNLYALTRMEPDKLYRPPLPGLGQQNHYEWYKTVGHNYRGPIRVRRDKPRITYTTDPEIQPTVENAVRVTQTSHPYLLNWDKHEFVSKRKVPRVAYSYAPQHKTAIHPLPLLTVEGNGRGGGDFHVDDAAFEPGGWLSDRSRPQGNLSLIGSWARDHISVNAHRPEGKEWTEIKFDLVEMGAV